jgi:hypothetical protein
VAAAAQLWTVIGPAAPLRDAQQPLWSLTMQWHSNQIARMSEPIREQWRGRVIRWLAPPTGMNRAELERRSDIYHVALDAFAHMAYQDRDTSDPLATVRSFAQSSGAFDTSMALPSMRTPAQWAGVHKLLDDMIRYALRDAQDEFDVTNPHGLAQSAEEMERDMVNLDPETERPLLDTRVKELMNLPAMSDQLQSLDWPNESDIRRGQLETVIAHAVFRTALRNTAFRGDELRDIPLIIQNPDFREAGRRPVDENNPVALHEREDDPVLRRLVDALRSAYGVPRN